MENSDIGKKLIKIIGKKKYNIRNLKTEIASSNKLSFFAFVLLALFELIRIWFQLFINKNYTNYIYLIISKIKI